MGGVEPVPGVRAAVAEAWLRCAEEAAAGDWPAPVRDRVPVNVTVPAVGPEQAHGIVARGRLRDGQGQGGRARPDLADDQARVEAVRDALGAVGPGARRRQRRLVGRRRGARDRRAGQGRRRARVRRAALRDGRGAGRGAPRGSTSRSRPTSRSGGPRTPTGSATSRPPTSRCSRCSRSAGCAPACGSPRRSGCRSWCPRRWRPRSGSRPGSRWPAALPELPYACGLATVQLLTADVVAEPLLPVDGVAAGRRPAVDPHALDLLRRDARPGRALGGAAGRGAGRAVSADRRWPARVVTALVADGVREVVLAPGLAQRAAVLRGVRRRRGRACSGCTPGSTSGPPASWPSG